MILVDGERLSTTPGGPIDFDRLTTANIKKNRGIEGSCFGLVWIERDGDGYQYHHGYTETSAGRLGEGALWKVQRFAIRCRSGDEIQRILRSDTFQSYTSSDGYDLTPETPESFTENPSHHMTIEEKLGWNNQYSRITVKGSLYWGEVENPWESTAPTHYRSLTKTLQVNAEHAFNDRYKLYGTYAGDFYTRKTVYDFLYLPDSTNAWSHEQTVRLVDEFKPWDNLVIVKGFEWNGTKNYNKMQYGKEKRSGIWTMPICLRKPTG